MRRLLDNPWLQLAGLIAAAAVAVAAWGVMVLGLYVSVAGTH